MNRRAFLGSALGTAALGVVGCGRRAAAPAGAVSLSPELVEIEELTIPDLRRWIAARPHGARDLLERYLARIEALDRTGPTLRAVIELNPDARALADAIDEQRRRGAAVGPLAGIPILLKDNIDTADRMQTTAGSLALVGRPARADAAIVLRLRAAGAVLLGKTNLSEWANIRDRRSTSAWSARGGLTRSPYVLDRNPSGSSSGSAVAVAANLCAAAIGTETVGSIVSPASKCGVVGLKPTAGLLPGAGIVPISHTQDTAGPIARTVLDAAIVQAVLAGETPPLAPAPGLPREQGRALRVGVRRDTKWASRAVAGAFARAVDVLKGLGAELVDPIAFPGEDALSDALLDVLLTELRADLAAYLATREPASGVRTVDDVVRFNQAHATEELRWFGQDLLEEAARKGGLDTPAYQAALATCRRVAREEGLERAFDEHRLDVLVTPTAGPSWVADPVSGDNFTGGSARLAAVAGYPNVTVPCGDVSGLPLGISFVARPRAEGLLLRVAAGYEQVSKLRAAPRYRPTIDP